MAPRVTTPCQYSSVNTIPLNVLHSTIYSATVVQLPQSFPRHSRLCTFILSLSIRVRCTTHSALQSPLTSMRYSNIFFTCLNHHNTCRSTQYLPIPFPFQPVYLILHAVNVRHSINTPEPFYFQHIHNSPSGKSNNHNH